MVRLPARLLVLVAIFSCTLIVYGAAHAQTTNDDLRPRVNDVAPALFQPTPELASADPTAVVRQTQPQSVPDQFTDIMLHWRVDEPAGSLLNVEVRVSPDGATWSPWANVAPDERMDDGSRWSESFFVDQARFFQLRTIARPGTGGAQPTLHSLQAYTVFVEDLPAAEVQATLASVEPGSVSTAAVSQPAYVSRTAWGNPQGESAPDAPPVFRTATHLVVHHTAQSNTLTSTEPNWAARVRATWSFHTYGRGWGDIGYNWLIDPNGVIYAGRAGSNDTTRDAVGFHDTANHGSMGVSLIGNYETVRPTTAAQNSLVNLLAWKASQRDIDPLGRSYYYGCDRSSYCYRFNAGSVVPNIAGHRQVTPGHTVCPGDATMGIMSDIRQRVVAKINSSTTRPDNGDLTIDNHEASFTWTGNLVQGTCGFNNNANWTWASSADDGIVNDVAGVWRPNVPRSGQYKVSVHIPTACSGASNYTTNARYEIAHAGGKANVVIDQQARRGWVELGTWNFTTGNSGYVRLSDLTSEAFSARRAVMFDAVKWEAVGQPTPTPSPTPPSTSVVPAQLVSATLRTPTIAAGDVAAIEFRIKNTGTQPIDTQAPDAGIASNADAGWAYDEAECFAGGGDAPAFDRVKGRLRVALGFASGSATTSINCPANTYNYPWRWGTNSALQPGETRTVIGYVRFRTPGTYRLNATLVNEEQVQYGTDGQGTPATIGLTVTPETSAPATTLLDNGLNPQAAVYTLKAAPTSLLDRSSNAASVVENQFIGTFTWDGREQNWGSGGPNGQSDRFIVRQTRAFLAPTTGTYRFRVTSDDGGWLWVDGTQIVSNHGLHGTESAEGSVYLEAGYHAVAVKMFEHAGNAFAAYSWLPPGASSFTTIPAATSTMQATSAKIALAADDMGGSGIDVLRYRVDNGNEQQRASGVAVIDVPVGTHTINYQAEDKNGNAGSWKTTTLTVNDGLACSLNGNVRPNGSIDMTISCANNAATRFEIQARDTSTGHVQTILTDQRQATFFGTPGRTYELRVRASDGTYWGAPAASPNATLRVPTNASFMRIIMPRAGR